MKLTRIAGAAALWVIAGVALAQERAASEPAAADAVETAATIAVGPIKSEVTPAAPVEQEPDMAQLDEVMVTANKRKESARSLAGAVTAVGRERLDETGASNFGEYLSLSPGVNYNSGTPGYSVITIRGVSTDTIPSLAQTAVGVYYDDIPLTDPAAPIVVPDVDAYDAERIELLRGPQGALYGSASLGGAVNYIPEAPDAHNILMSGFASGSQATNSSLGSTVKAMLNLPIHDVIGLRAVGYRVRTPGYIDNIGTDTPQANSSETHGGRVILGMSPTDNSELRLTTLYQRTDVADAGYVNEALGDLKKSTIAPEPSGNQFRLVSLRYELDAGYGSWAFVGGMQDKIGNLEYDGATSLNLQSLRQKLLLQQKGTVEGYSGELRFVSPPGETFEFLAGISYADRDEHLDVLLDAATLAGANAALASLVQQLGLPVPGVLEDLTVFRETADISAPEAAAFADLTWRVTPALKLTAGGRYYRNSAEGTLVSRGVLVAPAGSVHMVENFSETGTGFNPKVSLAWQAQDKLLLYGLYSKGYRLGGPNLVPSTALTMTEPRYGPDGVHNFELGIKSIWLDGTLTADLSAFRINWSQIPLIVMPRVPLFKYLDNAGDARINGLELSLTLRPWSFLTARSALTWTDARLVNDFDPNNGRPPAKAGDRLPGSPEWTTANSLTGLWQWGNYAPSLTLIHRYESASATNLSYPDVMKGDYHTIDLRAGLKLGSFALTAFGKNLTDARGVTASNNYAQPTGDVLSLKFITPPRTVGLELSYTFEQQ